MSHQNVDDPLQPVSRTVGIFIVASTVAVCVEPGPKSGQEQLGDVWRGMADALKQHRMPVRAGYRFQFNAQFIAERLVHGVGMRQHQRLEPIRQSV